MRRIRVTKQDIAPGKWACRGFVWGLSWVCAPFSGGFTLFLPALFELLAADYERGCSPSENPDEINEVGKHFLNDIEKGKRKSSYGCWTGDSMWGSVYRRYTFEDREE
ncbi:MAG: hypothetical protein HY717_23065 [Planctomycetes bacterium]|nr:hypothetical protein [Planctomycetota bacterium]